MKALETAKAVGIWIRVSTEDQVKGESPETHEKRCRLYAESKGWTVRHVYRLDAISGKSVMDRPETQRMLEDVRGGVISGLIFSKLARLARNTKELLEFSEIFRDCDADLISLQESIDTSTPAGRLFYTMIAALAQWEREEIASRVAASVPIRAKMGKPLGGAPPFGYQRAQGSLAPHPEEAAVRRRMYELFLEHRRTKVVARLLNQAGYRTRKGALFTHPTVTRLLLDPTAKGVHRVNYTRERSDGKGVEFKPQDQWVVNQIQPIVSEEVWDQAQAILVQRRRNTRPGRPAVHTFAGLTLCHCGQKMRVPSNTPKYVCIGVGCHNKIPIVDLDAIFHEQLRAFLLSPADIAKHLSDADETIRSKEGLLATLETERRKLAQEMEKTYRLYIGEEISKEGFGRLYRPLEERQKQIENELPALQAEIDFLKIQYLSRDEILSQATDLYARWPELAADDKRKIAEAIIERIVIGDGDVEIRLACSGSGAPPIPPKIMASGERNQRASSP